MKLFSLLTPILFVASVHAEVKRPGTIMEELCANATELTPRMGGYVIVEVCEGRIVGSNSRYLFVKESLALSDGSNSRRTAWKVTKKTRGEMELVKSGSVSCEGLLEKTSTDALKGKLTVKRIPESKLYAEMNGDLGGRLFKAADFYPVYHTMSW